MRTCGIAGYIQFTGALVIAVSGPLQPSAQVAQFIVELLSLYRSSFGAQIYKMDSGLGGAIGSGFGFLGLC